MKNSPHGADPVRTRPRNADAGPLPRRFNVRPRLRYFRVLGARPRDEWPSAAAYGMRATVTEEDVRRAMTPDEASDQPLDETSDETSDD